MRIAFRILAILLAIAALGLALIYTLEARFMGFPDGHMTELDRWSRPLYRKFAWVSLAFFVCSVAAAVAASKRYVVVGYFVLIALYAGYTVNAAQTERHYVRTLDHGIGG